MGSEHRFCVECGASCLNLSERLSDSEANVVRLEEQNLAMQKGGSYMAQVGNAQGGSASV